MFKKKLGIFEVLSENEEETVKKTKALYRKEMRNFNECFDLLSDLLEYISNELATKDLKLNMTDYAVFNNSARIIGTSKVYLDLVVKGYYYDSEIIHRSLVENIYLMRFFVLDKKNAEKWAKGETELKDILKDIRKDTRKELDLFFESFLTIYGHLSDYVHSNFRALVSLTENGNSEDDVIFTTKPDFRPDYGRDAFYPSIGIEALALSLKNFDSLIEQKVKLQTIKALERIETEGRRLQKRSNKRKVRNPKP